MTKVTLRIDRLHMDAPGISKAELEAALHREIVRQMDVGGTKEFVSRGYRPQTSAELSGHGSLPARIASAAIGAIKR
ncbi:MAG: hypothetical protein AB3N15_01545 [Paracoccaceae bacterium]